MAVGGEHDEVDACDELRDVGIDHVAVDRCEADGRVDALGQAAGDLDLLRVAAGVVGGGSDYPGEVVLGDRVEVDRDYLPHAEVRELLDDERATAADADHRDALGAQYPLSLRAKKSDLAVVALVGVVVVANGGLE